MKGEIDEGGGEKRGLTQIFPLPYSASLRTAISRTAYKTRAVSALQTHTVYSTMDLHTK